MTHDDGWIALMREVFRLNFLCHVSLTLLHRIMSRSWQNGNFSVDFMLHIWWSPVPFFEGIFRIRTTWTNFVSWHNSYCYPIMYFLTVYHLWKMVYFCTGKKITLEVSEHGCRWRTSWSAYGGKISVYYFPIIESTDTLLRQMLVAVKTLRAPYEKQKYTNRVSCSFSWWKAQISRSALAHFSGSYICG